MRSPPSLSNERIQIINEEKQFTDDLGAQIDRWGLRDAGFQYNLVAILGSQSTGKSTLLNNLFGTTFDVMDPTRRRQTTKGIWMCRGKDMNIMVMDVEGTDGRERGEDQDFEKKSTLFTLASSEVLIVNLWESQVGLYQGANMGLIKTVFAVHSATFSKNKDVNGYSSKTMLLFVIRDYEAETPLSDLSASLTTDLQKMWDEVSGPQNVQYARLSDHFDLEFTTLPHKRYHPEKFNEEAINLRGRFIDDTRDDYVFKPAYHRRIPADGVARYMEDIWEQVRLNKDLDVPTHRELLAQFRCDEIAKDASQEFDGEIKSLQESIDRGNIIEGLGGIMEARRGSALACFNRHALRYHIEVSQRKRAELFAQINTKLRLLFIGQVKNLRSKCENSFRGELFKGINVNGYDFSSVVDGLHQKWEDNFREVAAAALLPNTDWSYDGDLKLLRQDFRNITDPQRDREVKRVIKMVAGKFCPLISDAVEQHMKSPKLDMWDRLLEQFGTMVREAEGMYLTKTSSLRCTNLANEAALQDIRKIACQAFRNKITEQTNENVLVFTLRGYFEESVRYNTTGMFRTWNSIDEVTTVFELATNDTLRYLPVYAKIAPQDLSLLSTLLFDEEDNVLTDEAELDSQATFTLLNASKQADIEKRVRRDIEAQYDAAKNRVKPWWERAWDYMSRAPRS